MSALWVCDGCGKRQPAVKVGHQWDKPPKWFQRSDEDGIQDACSRDCVEQISKDTGKPAVVLPW